VRRSGLWLLLALALTLATVASGVAAADSSTPPPTPVPPSGSPSPFPTALSTPAPGSVPSDLDAGGAILEDLATGQILYSAHADDRRPIASTTKIMTAVLALRNLDLDRTVRIGSEAASEGSAGVGYSELGLRLGERLTVRQLLYALMLQSANDAAVALADASSGSSAAFVREMNARVAAFGLHGTRFRSPNGLDDRGYSTARDLAAITRRAFEVPAFARVVARKFARVPAPEGPPRRLENRNALLWLYPGTIGVKTGFTTRAGYCLVAAAEHGRERLVAVVLGEPSSEASFSEAATLLDYGFNAFTRRTLVKRGEALPSIPFGTRRVRVEAGAGLSKWVPSGDAGPEVRSRTVLRSVVTLPIRAGTPVGTVRFAVGRRPLGSVPLVAVGTTAPARRPGPEPPWWLRGLGVGARALLRGILSLFG
jgi:D-alanyl-D-alanine carboxypeptidase (penicillin-binding protein 5/6)